MAWITTDTDVATTLTINKAVLGQPLPGYPKVYSLVDAFGESPAITVEDWHKMETSPRMERIEAFTSHVNAAEGISVEATQTNEVFRPAVETPGEIVEP